MGDIKVKVVPSVLTPTREQTWGEKNAPRPSDVEHNKEIDKRIQKATAGWDSIAKKRKTPNT